MGYRAYTELTECIPEINKLTLSDVEDLPWVAPKNIPIGSLTHRMMAYYLLSELYDDLFQCYEMQFYIKDVTPLALQEKEKELDLY